MHHFGEELVSLQYCIFYSMKGACPSAVFIVFCLSQSCSPGLGAGPHTSYTVSLTRGGDRNVNANSICSKFCVLFVSMGRIQWVFIRWPCICFLAGWLTYAVTFCGDSAGVSLHPVLSSVTNDSSLRSVPSISSALTSLTSAMGLSGSGDGDAYSQLRRKVESHFLWEDYLV